MDGENERQRSLHIGVPDAELRAFARRMAKDFFGGSVSAYVVSLIEADRRDNSTERRALQRVTGHLTENGIAA